MNAVTNQVKRARRKRVRSPNRYHTKATRVRLAPTHEIARAVLNKDWCDYGVWFSQLSSDGETFVTWLSDEFSALNGNGRGMKVTPRPFLTNIDLSTYASNRTAFNAWLKGAEQRHEQQQERDSLTGRFAVGRDQRVRRDVDKPLPPSAIEKATEGLLTDESEERYDLNLHEDLPRRPKTVNEQIREKRGSGDRASYRSMRDKHRYSYPPGSGRVLTVPPSRELRREALDEAASLRAVNKHALAKSFEEHAREFL